MLLINSKWFSRLRVSVSISWIQARAVGFNEILGEIQIIQKFSSTMIKFANLGPVYYIGLPGFG
jgi:hypothetical protein